MSKFELASFSGDVLYTTKAPVDNNRGKVTHVSGDTVYTTRPPMQIFAKSGFLQGDALISLPKFRLASFSGDALIHQLAEPEYLTEWYAQYSQLATLWKETTHPSLVKSEEIVPSFVQVSASEFSATPPDYVQSFTQLPGLYEIVAQSTIHEVVPVSEAVVVQFRELVASAVEKPIFITPGQVGQFVELVVRQRAKGEPVTNLGATTSLVVQDKPTELDQRSNTHYQSAHMLVVQQRIIPSNWFVNTSFNLVAQQAPDTFPMSPASFASGAQLAVQAAMRQVHRSADIAASFKQLVAQPVVYPIPMGQDIVGQLSELVARHVDTDIVQFSEKIVASMPALVATDKIIDWHPRSYGEYGMIRVQYARANPMPVWETDRDVGSMHRLNATKSIVPPPLLNSGQFNRATQQLIAQRRIALDPGEVTTPAQLYSQSQLIVSHRLTYPPDEVIDPRIGRHMGQIVAKSAQAANFTPADDLQRSRLIFDVRGSLAIRDGDFEPLPPNPPIVTPLVIQGISIATVVLDKAFLAASELTVESVGAATAVGDDGLTFDPSTPISDVDTFEVFAIPVVADTSFPDPLIIVSSADVSSALAAPVVAETDFADPAIPVSELQLDNVFAAGAIYHEYPDPMIPVSDLVADNISGGVLMKETAFVDPNMPVSDLDITGVSAGLAADDAQFPDPMIPVSDVEVFGASANAALDDGSFPDPFLPVSDADVFEIFAFPVAGDPSLDGVQISSDVDCNAIHATLVIRDTTMLQIPPRPAEPRPVVTLRLW